MKIRNVPSKQGSNPAPHRRVGVAAALATAGLCLVSSALAGAGASGNAPVDATRTAVEKWVETRRIISQEKRDLALAKEMLNERMALVQREIDGLREKIGQTQQNVAEADKKRVELDSDKARLVQASASLGSTVETLEARVRQLLKRLPEPIREHVKPLSQRLPTAPGQTKLSIAERFQNVVGILNAVNKFNREITVTSEKRDLPDGTCMEVTTFYVGIGQGYYANDKGTVGGIGIATDEGWKWTPANGAAPQIAAAIGILKNGQVASFIKLPVTIH